MKTCPTCGVEWSRRPDEEPYAYKRRKYCSQACAWKVPTSKPRTPLSDRFWPRVDRGSSEACWLWMGHVTRKGYGRITLGGRQGRTVLAHRVAYELLIGPIPEGLTLDHLCRNPPCVNPAHLEPVTMRENTLRGQSPGAVAVRTNKCKRGHEFTPDNTRATRNGRACRACERLRTQRRTQERRATS